MSAIESLFVFCSGFVNDESGATAIEYSLMVAMVALGALAAFSALGTSVTNMHNYVSNSVISAFSST